MTLDEFRGPRRAALKDNPGTEGRRKLCAWCARR